MSIYFLSFGGGSDDYNKALERIIKQAEEFNIFNKIIGLTEKDLIEDTEFWNKHGNFITNNSRGYGYYIWKPYIINKTLKKMNENDILLYLDSGCELNINGKNKLLDFFNIVKSKKLIGTIASSTDYNFTKMDLIKYMQMENLLSLLQMPHIQAGIMILLKCNETSNLINEWYNIATSNYHFINDDRSVEKNFDGFIEHRHDQSIFNLLVKTYGLLNFDIGETCWGCGIEAANNYRDAIDYPIWSCRNRTGKSIVDIIKK